MAPETVNMSHQSLTMKGPNGNILTARDTDRERLEGLGYVEVVPETPGRGMDRVREIAADPIKAKKDDLIWALVELGIDPLDNDTKAQLGVQLQEAVEALDQE